MHVEWIGGGDKEKVRARAPVNSLVSLLIRALIPLDEDLTLMTSFNINYLHEAINSKYNHIQGSGHQQKNLVRGQKYSVHKKPV